MSEQKDVKARLQILFERLILIVAAICFFCIIAPAQVQPTENLPPITLVQPPVSQRKIIEPMRLKIFLDETRTVNLPDKVEKVVVLSPVIVNVKVVGANSIQVSCLTLGETTIIAIGGGKRVPVLIEVAGHPIQPPKEIDFLAQRTKNKLYGDYSIGFAPSFNQFPALLRQTLSLRRNLSSTKTLRADTDFYVPLGKQNSTFSAFNSRLNLNRIELGLTEKNYLLDFLDSDVNLSRASLDNFLVRGFHYQKRDESVFGRTRRLLEVFGGLARPTFGFFDRTNGGLIGGLVPLVLRPDFILRTGAVTVINKKENNTVLRVDSAFEQSDRNRYELALDSDGRSVSFFGRTENKVKDFIINTETTKVSATSPFIKLGAQSSARNSFNASVYWNPQKSPFSAFASFERTKAFAFAFSPQNFSYNLGFFIANFNYTPNARTRLGLGYVEQSFDFKAAAGSTTAGTVVGATAAPLLFSSSTKARSFGLTYSQSFSRGFTNQFSVRPTFTQDRRSGASLNNGLSLQEELRRAFARFSVSGFTSITRRTTTLESTIINNPSLLPAELRADFNRNPAQFFVTYKSLLPILVGNLKLPSAGNFEIGARTQGALTKSSFVGDLRYVKSNFFTLRQNYILANFGYTYRFDDANLISISSSRLFSNTSGINGSGTIFLTYTYRFGGDNEKNFNPLNAFGLRKLFGFGEGQIVGRVFRDANGNSFDDEKGLGLANVKITLDQGKNFTTTDADGNYLFKKVSYGSHQVSVKFDELGVAVRATTPEEQTVYINKRSAQQVNFGLYDKGFIAGRVFNDAQFDGNAATATGLPNVRLNISPVDKNTVLDDQYAAAKSTDVGGRYDFYSLPPGKYVLEIDPATLPPDFRLPEKTRWEISVVPLLGNYYDIPVFAQRAIAGTVFVDKDGDNVFDPQKDEPLEGIRVIAQRGTTGKPLQIEAVSGKNGAYILRNLPAGAIDVQALPTGGKVSPKISVSLDIEPVTKRGVNLSIPR